MRNATRRALLVSAAALVASSVPALAACGTKSDTGAQGGQAASTQAPAAEPLAALTPPTGLDPKKVSLGRALFHDTRLSADNTIACATCHSLDMGGAEHKKTSTGIGGQIGPINSPTVLNAALNFVQFWDGRAATLEEQAGGPIANPIEMGSSIDAALTMIRGDARYAAEFAAAYPDGVTEANLRHAIAEYERSLITPSRFDRYLAGQRDAITEQERRGYETFKSVGCTACHTGAGVGGSMFQKMGLVQNYFELRGGELTEADNGRFNVTRQESDRHVFKVPTLRNVELTAPYFHDGSQDTLEGAVRVMGRVQLGRTLTDAQVADIVAFLKSLTGEIPAGARMPPAGAQAPGEPGGAPGLPSLTGEAPPGLGLAGSGRGGS
jgi:cytochrome c peroxidase